MDVQEYIDMKLVHEIHTSERKSFRACRRRWDWLFRQSIYPKTTAKPLEFGVAFHKGMETYYDPETWHMDRQIIGENAILDFINVCEKQRTAALEFSGQTMLEPDVQIDYDERVELGKGMMHYYFNKVAPRIDVGWKPVKVEIAFMIPIPNPETGEKYIWCKCDECLNKWHAFLKRTKPVAELHGTVWTGLPVVYAGRLDMLAEDEHGNYWIFDWKTARSISADKEFLYLDDQIGSYVWALRKVGLNVRGFVYHEQRKGFPQPPKKNVSVRKGCAYSVSKSQDVDYATYKRHVEVNDAKAYELGYYDEFLEYLRLEGVQYYDRVQVSKSPEEIESIERDIGFEALDMIDQNLRIYPSPGRFGCNFCAFRQPCLEKTAQGDYQYALDTLFERREHYYVRQEASTESKGGE